VARPVRNPDDGSGLAAGSPDGFARALHRTKYIAKKGVRPSNQGYASQTQQRGNAICLFNHVSLCDLHPFFCLHFC
jgi:hypothetical protein